MKYIIIDNGRFTLPYLFSELDSHNEIAKKLLPQFGEARVIGAGFCSIKNGWFVAYGESTTLGIKSGQDDTKILNDYLIGSDL